jgi:hypothetical protein
MKMQIFWMSELTQVMLQACNSGSIFSCIEEGSRYLQKHHRRIIP